MSFDTIMEISNSMGGEALYTFTQYVGAVAAFSAAVFIFLSFLMAKRSWEEARETRKDTKKTLEKQTFLDLRREYRSKEMGIAIARLWKLYREDCKEQRKALIDQYFKESKGDQKFQMDCIHNQRRMVSQFYQELENLLRHKIVNKKLVLTYWTAGDLEIIPNIIEPIETVAIPKLMGNDPTPKSKWPEWITNLLDLYRRAKNREVGEILPYKKGDFTEFIRNQIFSLLRCTATVSTFLIAVSFAILTYQDGVDNPFTLLWFYCMIGFFLINVFQRKEL